MDLVGLQAALDKLNNVTIPKIEELMNRFESSTMKDLFANLNKLLDRVGIQNPETDKMLLDELADIKHILAKMAGITK